MQRDNLMKFCDLRRGFVDSLNRPDGTVLHFAAMPLSLTTFAHLAMSALIWLRNSSGVFAMTSAPSQPCDAACICVVVCAICALHGRCS